MEEEAQGFVKERGSSAYGDYLRRYHARKYFTYPEGLKKVVL